MSRLSLIILACTLFISCALSFTAQAAPSSPAVLESMLKTERKKAAERKKNLEKLTTEERTLHKDLEKAEQRILAIENNLSGQQEKLSGLLTDDENARKEYQDIILKQADIEKSQAEVLMLLWELTSQEISAGSREIADWPKAHREYHWSQALYKTLEEHRKQLDAEETALAKVLGKREKLSQQMQLELKNMDREKQELLKARLDYNKRLSQVRKDRETAQADLDNILKLVDSLNLQLAQQTGDIQDQKGRLPKPAQGTIKKRFSPNATPPYRGIGISTEAQAPVIAVAKGVVVHNDMERGFGRVVLIQHGKEYYSLYAFLSESSLTVGQNVTPRQVIGKAGVYPEMGKHGIYFELRFKQKAINPELWFAS